MLDDYRSAPISAKDKALFGYIEKIAADARQATADDIRSLNEAGWCDEVIYDAATVCALFQYYNSWVDSMGGTDLPAAMYAMTGKRLAAGGYYVEQPEQGG